MIRDETLRQADENTAAERQQPRRWPYGWVGLALFFIISMLLGGAFVLDQWLKPPVGIEPATVLTPSAQPAVIATISVPAAAPTASLEQQILDAYLHYWKVRTDAYYRLEPALLSEVMAGAELSREREQMQDFTVQGKAVKVDVDHHPILVEVGPERALVYDEYLNRSVFIDSATKEELLTKEPPGIEKVSYEMQKIDGRWKVLDGRQHR